MIQKGVIKNLFFSSILSILSFLLLIYACGGSGGSEGPTAVTTPISSTSQAGQIAGWAMSSVDNLANANMILTGLFEEAGAPGSTVKTLSQFTVKQKTSADLPNIKRIKGLLKGFSDLSKRHSFYQKQSSVLLNSVTQAQQIQNCGISGTFIYDDLGDSNDTTYRITFNACREIYDASTYIELNGTIELNCSDTSCNTLNLHFGTADSPYRESYFNDSEFQYKTDEFRSQAQLSLTSTNPSRLTGNGYIEYYLYSYYPDGSFDVEKERFTMNNIRMDSTTTSDSGSTTYSVTSNGTWQYSYSLNGNLIYSVSTTFSDLNYRLTDAVSYSLLRINGLFSVDLYPDNLCFEGAFTVTTDIPIRYDYTLGRTVEGQLRFNDNTKVIYNYDGSITVVVNGHSFTYQDLYTLYNTCPLM